MLNLKKPDPVKMAVLKITPHRNTKNNETRRLYSALHDFLLPVKGNPILDKMKRVSGLSATPVSLWWIVRLSATEEKKTIEFFVAMPETHVDAYKTKFKGLEGWKSSTLETVDQFVPVTDTPKQTDIYKLAYKRHDMFSLEFNYSEQETPIGDMMRVIEEMKAGESLTLFMKIEAVDRMKWKRSVDYAWEEWRGGEVPYRPGFNPVRLAGKAYELGATGFYKAHNGVSMVLGALSRQVAPPGSEKEFEVKMEPPKRGNHEREALLVNGDLSNRTKQKRNAPVFKTWMRYVVTSPDPVRREMLARSLAAAYESPDKASKWKDNVLVASRLRQKKRELESLQRWEVQDLDPMRMSVDEVGTLQQLPTKDLQEKYKEMLESNQRTEIEVPKLFLDKRGLLAGTATERGAVYDIFFPTDNKDYLFAPRAFLGSPRMGKDQAIVNLLVEAKRKHGIGAVIPDFIDEPGRTLDGKHWRGMANAVRDALPASDVIDINLADTDFSLYFGLESAFKYAKDQRVTAGVISKYLADFLSVDGDENRVQTKDFITSAAKVTRGDLTGIKLMFTSQEYRRQKIEEFQDIFDMDIWVDYDQAENKQGQIRGPILRRLNQILGDEFLKPMFAQTGNGKVDLYDWIRDGKVVIIRCKPPEGVPMPEETKQALGDWITLVTFLINLSLNGTGTGCFMVHNEAHQYLSKGMVHILKRALVEGPKYRFALVFAFHFFSQFDSYPGFIDTMIASNCNWHLFKNSNLKVYERLMIYLSQTFEGPEAAFQATKARQFIACWTYGGEYLQPFVCDALPMVNDRYEPQDNAGLTKEHIKKYGRPTRQVLEEIRVRNRMSFQPVAAEEKPKKKTRAT